jgi:TonB family protein
MGSKSKPAHKVLRIGIIQGGKILEERLIRSGDTVTVGESTKNTFVLPPSFLPKQHRLFSAKAGQYALVFTDQMQGKVSVNNAVQPLGKLKGNVAKRRGDGYWLPLTEQNRGKVQVGPVTILFQFVQAPPEPKRVAVTFSPFSLSQVDWVYWGFFFFSCVVNTAAYIYIDSQPPPGKVSIDDIPERFTQAFFDEDALKDLLNEDELEDEDALGEEEVATKEEEDSAEGAGEESENEGSGEEEEQVSAEDLREQRRAEMMQVGLAALIGTTGETGNQDAVADLLADGGELEGNLDRALASADGIRVARRGEDSTLRTGGGGSGDLGSITDMAGSGGGGPVGGGSKKQTEVKASVSGAMEVSFGDVGDMNSVKKYVGRKKGQIKACYEEQLKANPDLGGKVEVIWTVNPDGSVSGVKVENNSTGNQALADCIVRRIKRWSFPEQEDEFEITYPFNFFSS